MTVWTRADFHARSVKDLHEAGRKCPDCGAIDQWTHKGCANCNSNATPDYACQSCKAALTEEEEAEYNAVANNGNHLTSGISVYHCSPCDVLYIYQSSVVHLDEFVNTLPADLKILPELGIQTSAGLEIFVSVYDHPVVEVKSQRMPLRLALQEQSEMFSHCLNYTTKWDTSDYGHDMSSTLLIEPPPPYSDAQRRELHVLLSQLTREAGAPLRFWTSRFRPNDDEAGPFDVLAETIETWRLDDDRSALSLASHLIVGSAQGPFINAFRLLELTLKRIAEDELERNRTNVQISRSAFLEKIRELNFDLASRLRCRIKSLSVQPTETLRRIWSLLVPSRGYNPDNIFQQIAQLRNQNAHEPKPEEALRLPWEEFPFDEATELIATLTNEIIATYEGDVS